MRTFCCCLPSRMGVLLLSPLTCAASTACSVVALYSLISYHPDLSLSQRIFLGLLGAAMIILALSSIFGFFGALFKNLAAVSFYASSLTSMWLSIVATGIINFVFLWKDKEEFIDQCATRSDEEQKLKMLQGFVDQEKLCKKDFTLGFALLVAIWGTVALMSLYLISIVRRYCKQLAEERYVGHHQGPKYEV